MSKSKVIVVSVVEQGLSKAEAARRFGVSWQWVHTLVTRYEAGGLDAVEPRSRRPGSNPRAVPGAVRERIIELRVTLTAEGLDAGPATIAWHLRRGGADPVPALSTIRRVITDAGLVVPEPRKRPKASLHRFEAEQPNETWQSDFTHWTLADGTDAEILAWLDDHSRYLLSVTAHHPVTGADVVDTFTGAVNVYGPPASTLTDNGTVYTTRLLRDAAARNAFEYLLAALGITQRNGKPYHPQTQGKIERFWQTLKRWLATKPPPATVTDLQGLLDRFARLYNNARPHRSLGRATPAQAYTARPKARPEGTPAHGFYRVRNDHVGSDGKISLRRAGKMHHLGVGVAHAGKPVVLIITEHTVTVVHRGPGQTLATNTIDPDRTYWRNTDKQPGRWPNHEHQ
jgi:transposase InsO family protein